MRRRVTSEATRRRLTAPRVAPPTKALRQAGPSRRAFALPLARAAERRYVELKARARPDDRMALCRTSMQGHGSPSPPSPL
jgi:hypothetical protein